MVDRRGIENFHLHLRKLINPLAIEIIEVNSS